MSIYIYFFFSHFPVHAGTFITGLENLSHFTLYRMLDDHIFIGLVNRLSKEIYASSTFCLRVPYISDILNAPRNT